MLFGRLFVVTTAKRPVGGHSAPARGIPERAKTLSAEAFLRTVLGDEPGTVCAAWGLDPYLDDNDKLKFAGRFHQKFYEWPADVAALVADARNVSESGNEAFYCAALRAPGVRRRLKGQAVGALTQWVDLDNPTTDPELYDKLDPLRVRSGTDAHEHGYVLLSEAATPELWNAVQRELRDRLGGDTKIADNDVLRIPGTHNHKTDPPGEVHVIEGWRGTRWRPAELARLLGIDPAKPPRAPNPRAKPTRKHTERTRNAKTPGTTLAVPACVERAMQRHLKDKDRSGATYAVANECRRAGLDQEQTVELLCSYPPAVDKYGDGDLLITDVERTWAKAVVDDERSPDSLGEFTDARLTDRLAVEVFTDCYCWVSGLGWLGWNGQRWRECTDATVTEAVRVYLCDWLTREAKAGSDSARLNLLSRLLGKMRITGLTVLAKGKAERRAEEFDADPDLLNTPSGVVDLRTSELRPHDPRLLMTRMTGVAYRSGATHSDWTAALRALPEDSREYFLDRCGQAVTGHLPPDDKLLVQMGSGANGKTTVNAGIAGALGDYASLVPRSLLLADPRSHPTGLMTLRGTRFAYIEELPEARKLNVQGLKEMVGTPQITARSMHKDFVTFRATHALTVSTNYLPIVSETDYGTWRRLELVKFPYTYRRPGDELREGEREGDAGLRARIEKGTPQQAAVLAALVEHAKRWYERGRVMPSPPHRVGADTAAWRREDDTVLAYAEERLVPDPDAHVMSADLLEDLNVWLRVRGHNRWADKLMTSRFGGHDGLPPGMEKKKVRANSTRYGELSRPDTPTSPWMTPPGVPASYTAWLGVRFRTDEDEDDDDE